MYQTKDTPPDARSDLTHDSLNAIKSWIKDSTPINTALRYDKNHEYFKGKPGLYEKAIIEAELLTEAINNSTLQQEYTVSRGLGSYDVNKIKQALDEKRNSGTSPLLVDDGFTAVSYQNDVAFGYSEADNEGERYLLISTLQRGDRALFIGNESTLSNRKEGEILLQKGSRYYITRMKTYIAVEGEVIHQVFVEFI